MVCIPWNIGEIIILMVFWKPGGASSDLAVADYVIGDIAYGLVDLHLQGHGFGCSTIAAVGETGGRLYGR